MKYTRYLCIGPGGRKCHCCFPAPSTKKRRAEYRKAKHRDSREVRKTIYQELEVQYAHS